MVKNGHPAPQVLKFKDGNEVEAERLKEKPQLADVLKHTCEGDNFQLVDVKDGRLITLELKPIETPGHLSDHLCFLLKEEIIIGGINHIKYHLFSGDHIVGANSTWFKDYPQYFESLIKTQKLIADYNIERMFVAHSVSLLPKDTAVPAAAKNQSYITRRVRRDRFLEAKAMKLSIDPRQNQKFTLDEFYAFSMNQK